MRNAERVTSPLAYHGEGPFWDAPAGRLLCVDLLAGEVVALDHSGCVSRYKVPSRAATVVRRRATGGLIIGTEHGVIAANDDLTEFRPIANVIENHGYRTNDGGCDPLGGFVIGSMSYDGQPGGGAVYRVTPDHQVVKLLSPVSISNGVQWSTDGTRVFYVDSPTQHVDMFDFDTETGRWLDRRVHIRINEVGVPDGMAIDEEDGLWVALWGGGAVNHYDSAGRFLEAIRVPGVTQVSSCTFGGDDRNVLYITTSRQGLRSDQEIDAGAIFAFNTGTRGAPPFDFGG